MKKLRVEEAYVRIILHGFHSHSWCHSISNYYPSPISSSAASDMLKIIYLLHHWGQWRERYEWTFREINNKKKKSPQSEPSNKNRRMFSALLYIKYRVKCTAVEKEEMNQYTELPDLGVFFFLSLFACWLYLYLKINLSDFQVWKISNQFPSWWHVEE